MSARVKLTIESGPSAGRQFDFRSHDTMLFGRHSDCHLQVPGDGYVSRHHFLLELNPPDARLRDLGSLNGTHINQVKHGGRDAHMTPAQGKRLVIEGVDLSNDDLVVVGNTQIRVEVFRPPTCDNCSCALTMAEQGEETMLEDGVYCQSCLEALREMRAESPAAPLQHCCRCGVAVGPAEGTVLENYQCIDCSFEAALAAQAHDSDTPRPLQPLTPAPSPTDSTLQLDDYEFLGQLGRGGMGMVYLAKRRDGNGPQVAIKRLLAQVAVRDDAQRNFLREIEINLGLEHENIVRLLEQGAVGRQYYFVMEYCDGGTLAQQVAKVGGHFSLNVAAPLMLQALEGLQHAHQLGIVHRDLKPHNLLFHGSGADLKLKLADFGLAKCFQLAGLSGMTATGSFGGSWQYMPREQVTKFKYVQPASDVWSIAASFYFMLSGAAPRDFAKERDPIEVLLNDACQPLRNRNPGIPARVAAVIDRALSDVIEDRYPDAGQFCQALAESLA